MGFVLGMTLAGVGGIPAKTLYFLQTHFSSAEAATQNAELDKKIDDFWAETGLSLNDVNQLIGDQKCHSSERYFKACLSSVIHSALKVGQKISTPDLKLVKLNPWDNLDEKTEKQLVNNLLTSRRIHDISFEQIIPQITTLERAEKRSSMSALMINSFLSVYFDPHTYILPAHYYDEVGSKLERPSYFVGVTYEKEQGGFYIRRIVRNSDADIAGLRVNDRILEVNSHSLDGLKIADLSRMLRNQDTPEFNFFIERNGEKLMVQMKRSYRNLKYVDYSEIGALNKKYALITLAKFARGSCAAMGEALDKAKAAEVSGVVLDLRDNPGGQLDEAGCIEGLFLGANKKAYYIEYFDGLRSDELVLTNEKQKYRGPLVVMLNAYSASASEVLAGSLQVYKRALIVGDRSFGKGTFQEPEEWVINSNVSLFRTQGFYLLPDKSSTQLWGVQPEISLDVDVKAKREADLFLNPLVYTQVPKLRLGDEVKAAQAMNMCKNKKLSLAYDDSEVVESIRYMGCADSEHINMAQLADPNLNNSF